MTLAPVGWQTALIFLNDIITLSRTAEEYTNHVRQVLTLQQKSMVNLKLKNCRLITNTMDYVGLVFRQLRQEIAF